MFIGLHIIAEFDSKNFGKILGNDRILRKCYLLKKNVDFTNEMFE